MAEEKHQEDLRVWLRDMDLLSTEEELETMLDQMAGRGLDSLHRLRYADNMPAVREFSPSDAVAHSLLVAIKDANENGRLPRPAAFEGNGNLRAYLERHDLGVYFEKLLEYGLQTSKLFAMLGDHANNVALAAGIFRPYHIRHIEHLANLTELELGRKRKHKKLSPRLKSLVAWLRETEVIEDEEVEPVAINLARIGVDCPRRLQYANTREVLEKAGVGPGAAMALQGHIYDETSNHQVRGLGYGDEVLPWLKEHELEEYAPRFKASGYSTRATVADIHEAALFEMGICTTAHKLHLLDMVVATRNAR
jgi:hypothetical protein